MGLGESFQTVLLTMGRKLPQGAQKRENKFAAKPGKPGDSPEHEILPRWQKWVPGRLRVSAFEGRSAPRIYELRPRTFEGGNN